MQEERLPGILEKDRREIWKTDSLDSCASERSTCATFLILIRPLSDGFFKVQIRDRRIQQLLNQLARRKSLPYRPSWTRLDHHR